MNSMYLLRIVLLVLASGIMIACDDNVVYNPSDRFTEIPVVEVFIDDDEYFNLLQNKTTKTEAPVKIYYRGKSGEATIRSSGGGSRLHPRWSYRVELSYNFEIEGLTLFTLNSQSLDPSMIRTTVVSRLYSLRGIPVFKNKHVFLKINNQDQGLYLLVERIEEEFFRTRSIPLYELYKATLDAELSFGTQQHPRFTYEKKIPEDNNYAYFYEYINAIDMAGIDRIDEYLSRYMDIDNYIRYHALASVTNNVDAFRNNYYLYRTTVTAPYKFLPWDFDRSFGPDQDVGLAGVNALFSKISQNDNIREKYLSELSYLLENCVREEVIFPIIDSTAAYIKEAYLQDPYLGAGGYDLDFQVSELKLLVTGRIEFFREQLDGTDDIKMSWVPGR